MWASVTRAIGALTGGEDVLHQFDLAAERIQSALLDVTIPKVAGFDIGVHAEPARRVGGDYIDIFPSKGHLMFGLGDASGKSLAAALNALMLRYLIRGLVEAMGCRQLGPILSHTNSVVSEDLRETDHFITLLLGTLDAGSGRLRIANAGHEPPLVLRASASDIELLTTHDIVLGVDERVQYHTQETDLGVGDKMVAYTDGLTEATDTHGELYTIERLRENFLANRELPAQELADSMFQTVKEYAGEQMRDDATILVIGRVE